MSVGTVRQRESGAERTRQSGEDQLTGARQRIHYPDRRVALDQFTTGTSIALAAGAIGLFIAGAPGAFLGSVVGGIVFLFLRVAPNSSLLSKAK